MDARYYAQSQQMAPGYGQYRGGLFSQSLGIAINPADMLNAIPRVYTAQRRPNIDPKKPMSDKAAHLLSLGGSIRGDA